MSASPMLPTVRRMLDEPGYYIAYDSRLGPRFCGPNSPFDAPLISKGGKVFCVIASTLEIEDVSDELRRADRSS